MRCIMKSDYMRVYISTLIVIILFILPNVLSGKNTTNISRDSSGCFKFFDFGPGGTGYITYSNLPYSGATRFQPVKYPCKIDSILITVPIKGGAPPSPDTFYYCSNDSGTTKPGTILNKFPFYCYGNDGDIDTVIVNTGSISLVDSGEFWILYHIYNVGSTKLGVMSDTNTNFENRSYYCSNASGNWSLDAHNYPFQIFLTYIEAPHIRFDRDTLKIVYESKEFRADTDTASFYIINESIPSITDTLNVTDINIYSGSGWISGILSDTQFSLAPGDSQLVSIEIDTSGYSTNIYWDSIEVISNAPKDSPKYLPILLDLHTGLHSGAKYNNNNNDPFVSIYNTIIDNKINIRFLNPDINNYKINIFDLSGKIVYSKYYTNAINVLHIDKHMKRGVYLIRLYNDELFYTKKLVKIQ